MGRILFIISIILFLILAALEIMILLGIHVNISIPNINFKPNNPELITYNDIGFSCKAMQEADLRFISTACAIDCKQHNHIYYSATCDNRDNLICKCSP